jgi:hypothetical protein
MYLNVLYVYKHIHIYDSLMSPVAYQKMPKDLPATTECDAFGPQASCKSQIAKRA